MGLARQVRSCDLGSEVNWEPDPSIQMSTGYVSGLSEAADAFVVREYYIAAWNNYECSRQISINLEAWKLFWEWR